MTGTWPIRRQNQLQRHIAKGAYAGKHRDRKGTRGYKYENHRQHGKYNIHIRKTRKAYYTIQMDGPDGARFIDVMVSSSGLAYVMENEDGTAVYSSDGRTYPDGVYDELQALHLAREAFKNEYGGKGIEGMDKEGTGQAE